MATHHFNFTEKSLDGWVQTYLTNWQADPADIPTTGESWAQDRGGLKSVPGLHLRIRLRKDRDNGGWSLKEPQVRFYLMKKIQGRKFTRELGDRQIVSVQSAREHATSLLKALVKGEDPKEQARKEKEVRGLRKLTFQKALEDFLAGSSALTEGTRRKYKQALSTTFKDAADKPLTYFTERRVRELHEKRSNESRSRADQDFRVLRLVWNWARETLQTEDGDPVLGANPVSLALNKRQRAGRKGWNNVPRKESIIPKVKLPDWFRALYVVREEKGTSKTRRISCLFLEVLVLAGLRFNELAGLTWERVHLGMGTLTIPDESAKNRRALIRPITRRVREILEDLGPGDSRTPVFPGREQGKPLNNTRKLQMELQARTGLWITPHDLRRVYSSAATRAGTPPLVLKRLLNHLSHTEEVTEGYVRLSLDELLDFAQAVEDQILKDAEVLDFSLENKLLAALQDLPEKEKQRLLFQLAQARAKGAG